MKTWKHAAATAAAAAAALGLAACSSETVAGGGQDDGTYVIGYDSYFVGNTWSAQLEAEFTSATQREADRIADVIVTQSDNDAQRQISNVQSMIARNVDAIIVTPISPEGIAPVLQQAEQAGITVVLNAQGADTDAYASYVNVDDEDFGATGAEWLVDKLGGNGRIIAINGLAGVPTSDLRFAGAKKVFDAAPGIEIVSTVDGGWDQATTKTAVESVLAANPDIDGVWSQGGSMTLGAIEAFEAAGVPLVPMTGEDSNGLLKKWQALTEAGDTGFDCIAVAKPTWISARALENTLAVLDGEDVPKDEILDPEVITAENVGEFVRPDLPDSLWVNTEMTDDEIRALFAS
ncbi:ribose ABC transporter [Xylanimonas oleitrophica]|uniref:Ribose ABC transporter n=1 Tax=Xylanimonas oleitrophica TaxID=2607479 RepID=A0A2W5XX83_9MICO|nr:ABC transporter substrate-binding protein [Xylanimonas oleitrophica]PZR55318.1 ribose ABC transporter [Xylanimonas oleitrophica]